MTWFKLETKVYRLKKSVYDLIKVLHNQISIAQVLHSSSIYLIILSHIFPAFVARSSRADRKQSWDGKKGYFWTTLTPVKRCLAASLRVGSFCTVWCVWGTFQHLWISSLACLLQQFPFCDWKARQIKISHIFLLYGAQHTTPDSTLVPPALQAGTEMKARVNSWSSFFIWIHSRPFYVCVCEWESAVVQDRPILIKSLISRLMSGYQQPLEY